MPYGATLMDLRVLASTDVGRKFVRKQVGPATSLRAMYAMSGTGVAYDTTAIQCCHYRVVCARDAMSGTDVAYGATGSPYEEDDHVQPRQCRHACMHVLTSAYSGTNAGICSFLGVVMDVWKELGQLPYRPTRLLCHVRYSHTGCGTDVPRDGTKTPSVASSTLCRLFSTRVSLVHRVSVPQHTVCRQ
eukprot:2010556-Rhodomonas_salina.1